MSNISLLSLTNLGVDTPSIKQYESGDVLDGTPLEIGVLGANGLEHIQQCTSSEEKLNYIGMLKSVLGDNVNIYIREVIEEDCIYIVTVSSLGVQSDHPLNDSEKNVIDKWANKIMETYSLIEPLILNISRKNDRLLVKSVS